MLAFKVIITDEIGGTYEIEKNILSEINADVFIEKCKNEDDIINACYDADGILCNLASMSENVIDRLKKCKVISRYGVGVDNIDVDACTKRNILVANVPDYCFDEVAEHTIALLMTCARKVISKDKNIRNGIWDVSRNESIFRISGKVIAFLGFGNIPRRMLKKIKAFGFKKILAYDPFVDAKTIQNEGAEKVDFTTAIKEADFVSVHLPYNKSTKNIVNKDIFNQMKENGILINTSRGGVINEKDLVEALRNKKIFAAGLDVYSVEPLPKNSELLKMENCVLTDHAAWYSEESIIELKTKCAENVRDVLKGYKSCYSVNTF